MPVLQTTELIAYNKLPCVPPTRPLGDLLNEISANAQSSAGNPDLLFTLNSVAVVLDLYCTPTGNDVTGDGLTPTTAFRTIQRAFDEIPGSCSTGVPQGTVQINCLAGTYKGAVLGEKRAPSLFVEVYGDTSVAAATVTLSVGSRPPLTNNPAQQKAASFNNATDVPMTGVVFSSGSHWGDAIYPVGDTNTHNPITLDGPNCALSNLRTVETFDPALYATTVKVRPFVSVIDTRGTSESIIISNQNRYSTQLYVSGFQIAADNFFAFDNVNMYGNAFITGVPGQATINFVHNDGVNHNNVYSSDINQVVYTDGTQCSFGGIHECSMVIEGPTSECFIFGIARGRDGGNVAVYVGGPTGGRIGSATDCEFEFFDLEGLGIVQIQGAATRWGNHAPATVDGNPHWFVARYGAKMRVQTMRGVTAGVPCIFEAGCNGFDGFKALNGIVTNSAVVGDDVTIRENVADPGTTVAFSALPAFNATYFTRVA